MPKLSLFVRLEAKPGKEADVAAFLEQGLALAQKEAKTPVWFAPRLVVERIEHPERRRPEAGRQAHLEGPIAKALMANAPALFSTPPVIERIEVLGAKLPTAA